MGLSRTVSEVDGDFSRKSHKFPTPCILCPLPLKGFPWNKVPVLGVKNYSDGATGPTKMFDDIYCVEWDVKPVYYTTS